MSLVDAAVQQIISYRSTSVLLMTDYWRNHPGVDSTPLLNNSAKKKFWLGLGIEISGLGLGTK